VAPLVERAERDHRFPRRLFPLAGQQGYLRLAYPEAVGGLGLGYQTLCLLAEELTRVCSGIAGSLLAHLSIAATPLHLLGDAGIQARFLGPAMAGERIGCLGLTEPGAGSDAAGIRTRARPDGNGWILSGSKTFITNGPIADFAVIVAQTDPQAGRKGIGLFVVERGAEGFEQGPAMAKLGNHSMECGELVMDACRVPDSQRLGEPGQGFATLMQALTNGRMVVGARSVGLAQVAFEAALSYARERRQFGRSIGSFQLVGAALARMRTEIDAARLLCQRAAWLRDSGQPCATEASMAKLKATEVAVWVTGQAVQVLGGYGYMQEYPVERYFRDAKSLTIVEGTSEIQQLIIARDLMS